MQVLEDEQRLVRRRSARRRRRRRRRERRRGRSASRRASSGRGRAGRPSEPGSAWATSTVVSAGTEPTSSWSRRVLPTPASPATRATAGMSSSRSPPVPIDEHGQAGEGGGPPDHHRADAATTDEHAVESTDNRGRRPVRERIGASPGEGDKCHVRSRRHHARRASWRRSGRVVRISRLRRASCVEIGGVGVGELLGEQGVHRVRLLGAGCLHNERSEPSPHICRATYFAGRAESLRRLRMSQVSAR